MSVVAPEVKRRSGYDPHQPRDRKGRWVETGAEVRNAVTNALGKVTKINRGDVFHETTYDVQTADGKTQIWETSAVDVVRNKNGSAPSVAKPGTPAAQAETAPGAPSTPGAAPDGPQAATGGLTDAIGAVYLPPSGTGTPTQTDPVETALSVIDDARAELDIGHPEDVALGDLAEALAKYQTASGADREAAVEDVGNALNGLNLSDGATQDKVTLAVQGFLLAHHTQQIPGQGDLLDANLSPLDAAIAQVHDPAPTPAKVKLSDGSAVEAVQVTALKPGDKIQHKPGSFAWNWTNFPEGTQDATVTSGTIASVEVATGSGTGPWSGGIIRATLTDGKIVEWPKSRKVNRVIAPVDVAVDDVYDPADGSGPKTPETAGILTQAQQTAIKNKWKLPTGSIPELQAQLAAVQKEPTPSVTDLIDQGLSAEEATKKAKRLHINATDRAWKARVSLQAAIDTELQKDHAQGPTPLQKDVADGKVAKEVLPEAPLTAEAVASEVSGGDVAAPDAPKPPPDPAAEAAATDAAASPGWSSLDMGATGKPAALYTVSDAAMDSGVYGPGGIFPDHAWHDQFIAYAGPNSDPIPVAHLHVQGAYTVASGWAQTIDGKAYLVEQKPDESAAEAAARMNAAHAMLTTVLQFAPPEHHGVQRGIALLNGPNPNDGHWAEQYGVDGFKSDAIGGNGTTTFFNGVSPDPAVLAHEYGHNVDSNAHLSSQWFSTQGGPTFPGQQMSWSDAMSRDAAISKFYDGRFTETRPGKPITLGQGSVTEYGAASPKEDFAESVRLWMRDRRYGKVGYDPTTGDNIRFADLFPERAKALDARFGTSTDINASAAKKKRIAEYKATISQFALNANDAGYPPPWETPDGFDPATTGALFALDVNTATDTFSEAVKEFEAKLEADNAKKAAAAAAATKAAQAKAAKAAEQAVKSFEEAYAKGLLNKSEWDKLRQKRYDKAYNLKKKGVPADEADAVARAWEQAYIAEHWPQQGGPVDEPWHGKELHPKLTLKGTSVGTAHIEAGGKTVHPLAKQQHGPASQAKANIAAELASRLNNPDDWEAFRDYRRNLHPDMGGPGSTLHSQWGSPTGPNGEDLATLGPFDQYSDTQRQQILDKEVAARIQMWASSSGDENQPAVVMQMAAKDEFGLDVAHPAPRMSEDKYKQWQADYYTPEVQAFYRRFLRVQYEHTQEQLAAAGIKRVKLYRGMKLAPDVEWGKPDGKAKRPELQPLNSWSTKRTVAKGFSGGSTYYSGGAVVFEASIPAELVVGTATTGYGCQSEAEFVVMDAEGAALANNYPGSFKYSEPGETPSTTVGTGKFAPH